MHDVAIGGPRGSGQAPLRISVLGAGHTGPVLARVLVDAGYSVSISASGDPEDIALIIELLAPGARARWAAEAMTEADVVILAIPLHHITDIDPECLVGKIVVDTMNYWPPIDGAQPLFDDPDLGSSEIVANLLPGATVVKTLNHIGYHDLADARRAPGTPDRRALGVASDEPDAVAIIADVVEHIGYDAVRLPSLAAGRMLQPGGPVFGAELRRNDFENEVLS
ncbi:MAG: oxidoreductase [Nocardia sp.]|uniref:NADPH-dependent F420 reductase n=1 Tax=Nocardia sp. TaxID=1821 RepID=UPI00261F7258|nr:NAD(P)-binding domain-containing protein [Nocardia sp.]MCU1642920.1 oxidoreductase [Nocardia sp.]